MKNTIVIFTADHGELMGDHGLWKKGPFFYDGEINVPLLIKVPGRPHRSVESLVSSIDIYTTIVELLGLEPPENFDGISQIAALGGEVCRRECLVEYRTGYGKHDVQANGYIDSKYKFVQYSDGECELTDRIRDKEEMVNLAGRAEFQKIVCEYREKLLYLLLNTPVKYPPRIAQF